MPLNLSFTHLAVIGIVALVVLGPERLPEVARTAGNLWREWKRVRGDLEGEVREVMSEFTEPLREHFEGINETVRGAVDEVRNAPAPSGDAPPGPGIAVPPLVGAAGAISLPPLSAAMPALGPGTGLVSPGPELHPELPSLGPPPEPGTFVPFEPPVASQ